MSKITIQNNGFYLFLDDVREISEVYPKVREGVYTIARTSLEAIELVKEHGIPIHMSLDHDLGGDDTVMQFLKWLAYEFWTNEEIPSYTIHSANPVGSKNIDAFMDSWHRSLSL